MGNNKNLMNGILVFDRSIKINDNTIYGLVYNAEFKKSNTEDWNNLSTYVAYLVGTEYFLKNGGSISDDGYLWTMPDKIHTIMCNTSLHRILDVLMKGVVDYKTFEFDDPIVWEEGEVDDDGETAHFIISPELINRYIKKDEQ